MMTADSARALRHLRIELDVDQGRAGDHVAGPTWCDHLAGERRWHLTTALAVSIDTSGASSLTVAPP
jgi:hypothetical protein